jgi:hypothetical protein
LAQSAVETPAGLELRVTLRQLRRERGLSQRDLREPLSLASHSVIVDYESGKRIPAPDILSAYERFFDLRAASLHRSASARWPSGRPRRRGSVVSSAACSPRNQPRSRRSPRGNSQPTWPTSPADGPNSTLSVPPGGP